VRISLIRGEVLVKYVKCVRELWRGSAEEASRAIIVVQMTKKKRE
jgi:hypothetical protein